MPSKGPAGALEEIRTHIELAGSFVGDYTFEAFNADRRTVYAVIRCLEIISGGDPAIAGRAEGASSGDPVAQHRSRR
jgi:uncharacterized protein with HEPN domain